MAYQYAILRSDKSAEADTFNEQWLGAKSLGIEVTQPTLARRCELGNIDPQHSGEGISSAIERALEWDLPPQYSTLVTLRLDKDAVGAMAVLMLRDMGKEDQIDKLLVSWIGALDRMPFREAREKYPEIAQQFTREVTDAMNFAVNNKEWSLPKKVIIVADILIGKVPQEELTRMAEALRRPEMSTFEAEMHGAVAYIYAPGEYQPAREFGNKNYPVAVIFDPERKTESGGLQQRWCIIRQAKPSKVFDRMGFEEAINRAEANVRRLLPEELEAENLKWGGPPNMVVSPQGAGYGTKIPKELILKLAREHLESGVVT